MHWEILTFSFGFGFIYFILSGFRLGPEGKVSDLLKFGFTYAESLVLIMSALIGILFYQLVFQLGTEAERPFVAFSFLIAWLFLLYLGRNSNTGGPDFLILQIGFFAYFLFLPFFVFNQHPNLLEKSEYWLNFNGWMAIDLITAVILQFYTMVRLASLSR